MLPTIVAIVALSLGPEPVVIEDTAAVIEHNRMYDDDAKQVFEQFIFWDEDRLVIDFRVVKRRPVWLRDGSLLLADHGVVRRIRTTARSNSWTQFDPELENRKLLDKRDRRELSGSYPPTPGPAPPPAASR